MIRLPAYVKIPLVLIGLYVLASILSIGQSIFLPIIYAVILAVLLNPVVNFFANKGINRTLSVTIVVLLASVLLLGCLVLCAVKMSKLAEAWPVLEQKITALFKELVSWTSKTFQISSWQIKESLKHYRRDFMANSGVTIGLTLTTLSGVLATAFLTPVYVFMMLLYRVHLTRFLYLLFGVENRTKVYEVLTHTKIIVQGYMVGLFIEFVIIAILNAVGLFILGIEYSIILGVVGALLNIIPYLGGLVGVALFMLVAAVTKPPVYILYVVLLYSVVQFIDNNIITPKIVGSKVSLNALLTLLAVVVGGALWGIPGMFLSIPLAAILKVIFDRVEALKPWGFLFGDAVVDEVRNRKNHPVTEPADVEQVGEAGAGFDF